MARAVRIANASGYWGDDPEALARQVRGGDLDYVTLDFLAEITMVILRIARLRASAEGQEGMVAFLEKRRPRWVR
jgi:hypothetical protein